jgi:hypothetical protein
MNGVSLLAVGMIGAKVSDTTIEDAPPAAGSARLVEPKYFAEVAGCVL